MHSFFFFFFFLAFRINSLIVSRILKRPTIKITFFGINVTSASLNWPFSRSVRRIRLDTRGKTTTRIPLHATPPSQIPNKEKRKRKKGHSRSSRFSTTRISLVEMAQNLTCFFLFFFFIWSKSSCNFPLSPFSWLWKKTMTKVQGRRKVQVQEIVASSKLSNEKLEKKGRKGRMGPTCLEGV